MQFINRKILLIGGPIAVVLLVIGGFYAKGIISNKNKGEILGAKQVLNNPPIPIETVGGNRVAGMDDLGISWPGEIISLGNIEVQPLREGTITEWKLNIGQKVFKGQVLGRLSAPPATPELIKMLAEQAEGLAKARGQAHATINFAEKNKKQIQILRDQVEIVNSEKGNVLNLDATKTGFAKIALDQSKELAKVKQKNLRTSIEEILNRHIYRLTTSNGLKFYRSNSLAQGYGRLDGSSVNEFDSLIFELADELKKPEALPVDAMQKYLNITLKIVNTTLAVDFSDNNLNESRQMVADDRELFFDSLKDYREAQVNASMKEVEYKLMGIEQKKEFAEQIKEIDEKIAMLDKEQQMAVAEVKASEAAFGAVAGSINGGLNIVSPQTGIVSAIYKKNGEFVSPGTPLADINAVENKERFVRFYIPSNLIMPELGTELTIIRPGFANEKKKIKLIGVGTTLGSNGSYVADATFVDQVSWPVRASVRIMPPLGFVANIFIPLTAVWWDDNAGAKVWLVTEENRIRPQEVKLGRMLGDKLEILDGLELGNKYVIKALPEFVVGQMLVDIKMGQGQQAEDKTKNRNESVHGHDE